MTRLMRAQTVSCPACGRPLGLDEELPDAWAEVERLRRSTLAGRSGD